jgi:hypothetical protein
MKMCNYITNYYVAVEDEKDKAALERAIRDAGFVFLDNTPKDFYATNPIMFPTLENIKIDLETR